MEEDHFGHASNIGTRLVTDGTDGPTDAAGAVVDVDTLIHSALLNFLKNSWNMLAIIRTIDTSGV
ncbi:MAG: hypothetical protein ABIR66_01415 [Saprospiraceae bacterium]